ncbi:MAG: T9SS type A sorting domain-containing protein [Saprospiraceae bacterium]
MKNILTLIFAAMTISVFAQVEVTFQVDMTGQTVSADGVHIAGSLNGWNTESDLLTDQGNGIYAITLNLAPGADYEYKYLNGNAWGTEEAAPGICTIGGNNRIFTAPTSDRTLPAIPFNDCPTSIETQMVKFSVDMTGQTVSGNGVHVAGNFQAWSPGATAMTDVGNNIYEVTVPVLSDISVVQYKFVNGNDWGTEETPGAGCGNGDKNRLFIIKDAGDMIDLPVATFGGCDNPIPTRMVVFRLGLDGAAASPNGVHVAGNFQGWNPEGTSMMDIGNDTYEVAVEVMKPVSYLEYKYLNGNTWGTEEPVPEDCSFNTNRFAIIDLNSPDLVELENFVFGTCNELSTSTIDIASTPLFKISPTITNEQISITWETSISGQSLILVHDLQGKLVFQQKKENIQFANREVINVSDWASGMYIVQLRTSNSLYSQNIIVK